MKISIDARFLGPEGTGIGKYVENLIVNLESIDKRNEYLILLNKSNFHKFKPKNPKFKKILVDATWYSVKEQYLLPKIFYKEKPDLVHFTHFNIPLIWSGKFVVTIHDLTISKYGREISRSRFYSAYLAKKFMYMKTMNKAVNASERILVPSKTVRDEILDLFNISKEKIMVTYEAADEFTRNIFKKNSLDKFNIKKPYILTIGNSYPYKNVEVVIDALKSLPEDISLVHVSKYDDFSLDLIDYTRINGLGSRFKIIGPVHQKDLVNLYEGAKAFIFPSKSEGFGLPGLEAMAVGCPVVASNIDVFREIYGSASLYFNPDNSIELAKKILRITRSSELMDKLSKRGSEKVKEYSWKRTAEQTLTVYKTLLQNKV